MRDRLAGHGLDLGQSVEVEVLVGVGQAGPRQVVGTVEAALPDVLIIRHAGDRFTRVRWAAIATITDTITTHPANQ